MVENSGFIFGVAAHIARVGNATFLMETGSIALLLLGALVLNAHNQNARAEELRLVAAAAAALAGSILVISLTGLWPHHNQIFYIPACLSAIAVSRFFGTMLQRAVVPTLIACLLSAYVFAGAPDRYAYTSVFSSFGDRYATLHGLSPEASRLLSGAMSGTYARLGQNEDDLGHAIGLRDWQLACPRFHQYSFESEAVFDRVFDCASKSPTLLIARSFVAHSNTSEVPAWNSFVSRTEKMLALDYLCDASAGLRVCVRRVATGPVR